MRKDPAPAPRTGQHGVALIVSLLMLLVLSMIGLLSMEGGVMEQLMANNAQYQTRALNRAENALLVAEQRIESTLTGGGFDFAVADGIYDSSAAPAVDTAGLNWSFISENSPAGPAYVIEYAGPRTLPGESHALGPAVAGSQAHFYRVSVRAEDQRGALRLLQSIYATHDAP